MDNGYTEIEFGSQKVPVLKGGYYDRYRMNPDLILEAPLPTMHAAKPQSRLGSMNMIHYVAVWRNPAAKKHKASAQWRSLK